MTRINVVPPQELCDQHLLAELRELPRIPNRVKRRIEAGQVQPPASAPSCYVLGTGHVVFFYDKLKFLRRRYLALLAEAEARGFNVAPRWPEMPYRPEVWKDYEPDLAAMTVNRARICDRLSTMVRKPTWTPRKPNFAFTTGSADPLPGLKKGARHYFVVGEPTEAEVLHALEHKADILKDILEGHKR